ncbi:hypothetical protein HK100_010584 [Physocladia obscura]|uniref:Cilia- and flagella-associated protein 61 N-terminal domain-containing protein n=1 Tax=Physocladia obscura TaxID=109957 RepID=A0AAD5XKB7_9FUNG|nr:hypothetical protein HK100_010584 [Physocladia obscura]
MQIVIRRAEPRDLAAIKLLIKDETTASTLKKRFGNLNSFVALMYQLHLFPPLLTNLFQFSDNSPLSLVATDAQDTVVIGFCAFSNGPPPFVDAVIKGKATPDSENSASIENHNFAKYGEIACDAWDKWISDRYESKDITIGNTKFLAYFVAYPDHQIPFLDAALATVFDILSNICHICYMLPDILTLFVPLSSQKFVPLPTSHDSQSSKDNGFKKLGLGASSNVGHIFGGQVRPVYFTEMQPKTGNAFAPFALQVCNKRTVFPVLKIRKARIEDCDDLVPMFKKQNLLDGQNTDHFLAELLESKDENTKTLVADIAGTVVGFMSLTSAVDQTLLAKTFDLDAFDNLIKDVPPEILATANGDHIKPIPVGPDGQLVDAHLLAASHAKMLANRSADPIKAALEANSVEGRAGARAAGLIAAQEIAKEHVRRTLAMCNLFCVTLLCIEDDYANKGIEFVKVAFGLFPDRDYCILTVPTGMPEIPILRNFTMIQPRHGKMTNHCLYILNRFGCLESLNIRTTKSMDYLSVEQVTKGLSAEYSILTKFNESFFDFENGSPKYKSFIAETNGQPIGVAILEKLTFADTVSDQFDIEEFLNLRITALDGKYVLLRHLILNPLFSYQARWFLEEIMRMTATSCVLHPIDEDSRQDVSTRMLAGKELVPVKRRRQIIYVDGLRDGVSIGEDLPYNLQLLAISRLYEPKLTVNSKIVVVGGSDTGIAFLEKLVYKPHLFFTNIILISTAGIPAKPNSHAFVDNKCYSSIELKQLGLDHYVRIVRASTTEIDRVLKRVRLDNDAFITYDYLFLTPGVQFFASSIREDFEALTNVQNLTPRSYEVYMKASLRLIGREESQTGRIVIYGRDLQVYVTLQDLLKKGILPAWVVVIIPPLSQPSGCFDNLAVEEKVIQQVETLGVKILVDYKVSRWESTPSQSLYSITFLRKSDKSEIFISQVETFLYADIKSVDPDTFMSINDSCLVFDARLVIDKYFRTQDPYIYAAGSITKFSSKYQTKWAHCYFDSKEVGFKLAETVLPLFDPLNISTATFEDDNSVVKFTESKKTFAQLPGSLIYLHYDEPRLPSHTLEFGRDLVINNDEFGYFRIRVDPHGFIRSLTYLGIRKIPVDNYLSLFGLNERYLNRLVSRFDEGIEEIERDDLVKKFQASAERHIWDAQMFEFYLNSNKNPSFP